LSAEKAPLIIDITRENKNLRMVWACRRQPNLGRQKAIRQRNGSRIWQWVQSAQMVRY
jgi:hypothetical protein